MLHMLSANEEEKGEITDSLSSELIENFVNLGVRTESITGEFKLFFFHIHTVEFLMKISNKILSM